MKTTPNPILLILCILFIYKIVFGKKKTETTTQQPGSGSGSEEVIEENNDSDSGSDSETVFTFSNGGDTIKTSVTSINSGTYNNRKDLVSVKIGNIVTEIEKEAFYNQTNLESVTFANNSQLEKIREKAFENIGTLETPIQQIILPNTVSFIDEDAFLSANLFEITFLENGGQITVLNEGAFSFGIYDEDVDIWESKFFIPATVTSSSADSFGVFGYSNQKVYITIPENNGLKLKEGNQKSLINNGPFININVTYSD